MIETMINTAAGSVIIPSNGKTTVNPVMRPIDVKKSGSGSSRSSYSSMLNLTSRRGCGACEVVP